MGKIATLNKNEKHDWYRKRAPPHRGIPDQQGLSAIPSTYGLIQHCHSEKQVNITFSCFIQSLIMEPPCRPL